MTTISLQGRWAVRPEVFDCLGLEELTAVRQAVEGWLETEVPGEIHLDPMRAGQRPEPTVGANMPECRWPETKSWRYRTQFETDADFRQHERQHLMFEELDRYAQVFVNGQLVGEAANAFVPAAFDVKPCLVEGSNELVVRLAVGSELAADATPSGQGQEPRPNLAAEGSLPNPAPEGDPGRGRMWPGRKWLRKPPFTYGWDWFDPLPGVPVRLRRSGGQSATELGFEAVGRVMS
ncbi:MAG: sugar-binding domain-containing protein [Armatimonadota bacterium]